MALEFIDITDDTGRTSALLIEDDHALKVVGGLEHGLTFRPRTQKDARKLITWLHDNLHAFDDTKGH